MRMDEWATVEVSECKWQGEEDEMYESEMRTVTCKLNNKTNIWSYREVQLHKLMVKRERHSMFWKILSGKSKKSGWSDWRKVTIMMIVVIETAEVAGVKSHSETGENGNFLQKTNDHRTRGTCHNGYEETGRRSARNSKSGSQFWRVCVTHAWIRNFVPFSCPGRRIRRRRRWWWWCGRGERNWMVSVIVGKENRRDEWIIFHEGMERMEGGEGRGRI